jgi:hypothetical protein
MSIPDFFTSSQSNLSSSYDVHLSYLFNLDIINLILRIRTINIIISFDKFVTHPMNLDFIIFNAPKSKSTFLDFWG